MSIYYCEYCDQHRDADINGCEEHPYNENEICDACFAQSCEENEARIKTIEYMEE
jgi:hypothetical protein